MNTAPEEGPGGSAIHIAGSVTGNVQSGSQARAEYRQYGPVTAGPAGSPEAVRQLIDAVAELREQLRATAPAEVAAPAAAAAGAALDDMEQALSLPADPAPARIQQAVVTVTGALASVTGLAEAVQALGAAAAPWF